VKQRPTNLNLFTIRFPITAVVSILHRISGVVLFFLIPVLLFALHLSLHDSSIWETSSVYMQFWYVKGFFWVTVSALLYHLLAGARHLMMDMGFGESLRVGRITAKLVLALSILLSLGLGYRIWF